MLIRENNFFLVFIFTFFRLFFWLVSLLSINLQWHKRLFVFHLFVVNVTCNLLSVGLRRSLNVTSFSLLYFSLEEGIFRMINIVVGFIRAAHNGCCLDEILRLRRCDNLLLFTAVIKVKTFANRILSSAWINEPSLLRTSGLHPHLLWLNDQNILGSLVSNHQLILVNAHVFVPLRHKSLPVTTSCCPNISLLIGRNLLFLWI